jgi:hypothetical protein
MRERTNPYYLVLGVFAAAAVSGCQITLVTAYDDTFDQEVTSTQKDVDALMTKIGDDPTKPYSVFAADYAKVRTDMDALKVRAASHADNTDTVASVAKLQHTISEFQTEHSDATAAKPLLAAHVTTELDIMNTEFKILMAQELAKKTGQSKGS